MCPRVGTRRAATEPKQIKIIPGREVVAVRVARIHHPHHVWVLKHKRERVACVGEK